MSPPARRTARSRRRWRSFRWHSRFCSDSASSPIAPKMLIGMFPLVPLWLLQVVPSVNGSMGVPAGSLRRGRHGCRRADRVTGDRLLHVHVESQSPDWLLPKQELAREATRLWHRETHAPLRFVGGSSHFGNSVAFYSTDRPSGFVLLDFRQAPWVTPQALWRDGLLALCMHEDAACVQAATRLMHADTTHRQLSLKHSFWGREREPVTIEIFINLPSLPRRSARVTERVSHRARSVVLSLRGAKRRGDLHAVRNAMGLLTLLAIDRWFALALRPEVRGFLLAAENMLRWVAPRGEAAVRAGARGDFAGNVGLDAGGAPEASRSLALRRNHGR